MAFKKSKRKKNRDIYEREVNIKSKRKIFLSVLISLFSFLFLFVVLNKDKLSPQDTITWIWEDLLGFGGGQGYPVHIDGSYVENGNFKIMNRQIAMVSDVSFTAFNKKGKQVANEQHSFASPKFKAKGDHSIIYNVSDKGFQVQNRSSVVFKSALQNNIVAADISQNGEYVIVSESNGYLNEMVLFSKRNEEKYKYYFSEYYVTDVAINSKGSCATVCGISAKNGELKSAVYTFDFKSETPKIIREYTGNMLFSISFLTDSNIVAVGDRGLVFLNSSKGDINEFLYDQKVLRCFESSVNEGVVLALSATDDGRNCNVVSFDTSGNKKLNIDTEFKVKDVSLKNKNVAVLESGTIHKYNLKGDKKGEQSIGEDSKQIELYSSSVAFVLGVSEVYKVSI